MAPAIIVLEYYNSILSQFKNKPLIISNLVKCNHVAGYGYPSILKLIPTSKKVL